MKNRNLMGLISIIIVMMFATVEVTAQNTYDVMATAYGRTVTNVSVFVTRDNINALDEGGGQTPTCGPPFGYYDVFDSLRVNANDASVVLTFEAQNIDPDIDLQVQVLDENEDQVSGGCFSLDNNDMAIVTILPNKKYYIRYHDVGGNDEGTFDISISTNATLPVDLLRQSVTVDDLDVEIEFVTAQEVNSSVIIFEESLNGINWTELGQLDAAGNSHTLTTYVWKHTYQSSEIIAENRYYRVTAIDNDGSKGIFPIMTGVFELSNQLYTLVNDGINPLLKLGEIANKTIIRLQIYTSNGQLFSSQRVYSNENIYFREIVSQGTYFITLDDSYQQVAVEKIIIP